MCVVLHIMGALDTRTFMAMATGSNMREAFSIHKSPPITSVSSTAVETSSGWTIQPSNNSVHIFFIFSLLFKDLVYFMFFFEAVLNVSVKQGDQFELLESEFGTGVEFGIPLIILLVVTNIFKLVEMLINSRLAFVDPKTMMIGKDICLKIFCVVHMD